MDIEIDLGSYNWDNHTWTFDWAARSLEKGLPLSKAAMMRRASLSSGG